MELSLCYSIVYYYNDAQLYKQFLQIGQLEWSGVYNNQVRLALDVVD